MRIGFILSDQPLNRLDDVLMRGSSFILAFCSSRWENEYSHPVAMPLALQSKPGSSLDVAVARRLKERILLGTNARLSVAFLADGRI